MSTPRTSGPLRPTAITPANPWEMWRLGWMTSELWMNCTYDLMSRAHWPNSVDPTQAAARRAWQRRWYREALVGFDAAMQVQRAGYDLWFGQLSPWCSARQAPRPAQAPRLHSCPDAVDA
jgi:hypothetical protein